MFGWFKKTETPQQVADRLYSETLETFHSLNVVEALALMHRTAMQGGCSDEEWGHLVIGAWRTAELASQLAGYRVERETRDTNLASSARGAVFSGALGQLARTIESTDPRPQRLLLPDVTVDKARALSEREQLRDAATLLDRLMRQRQHKKAFEVWRACAKGAYMELPVIYAS